jgi:hypothetical protein
MSDFIRNALNEKRLMDAYRSRPDYQQNDYIGTLCVTRAKLERTKQKRLHQMLAEFEDCLYQSMQCIQERNKL